MVAYTQRGSASDLQYRLRLAEGSAELPALRAGGLQMTRRRKATRPAKPRVPLPRQTGGVHEDKSKRPWRERKHKKKSTDPE